MSHIGFILDSMVDQLKVENIFKDASNVFLSYVETEAFNPSTPLSHLHINKQANPKYYIEEVSKFIDRGIQHICIITSSKDITKSYEHAIFAQDILKDVKIDIIDSNTFGPGILYLLMCANLWISKNYAYSKIISLLKLQAEKGQTILITKKHYFGAQSSRVKRFLRPFIKGYVLSSELNYGVQQLIYKDKKIINMLEQYILGYKGFKTHMHVFVYSGGSALKAKQLQHELYTKNKELNINLYGEVAAELTQYFGDNMYGIYLGYYEEAFI